VKVDFHAQVVLVTGATRGIGKQIALDFAGLGARLILTGTQQSQSDALNQALKERGKNWGRYYCVDFAKRESMEAFLRELGHLERIDVCINNAGINRIDYLEEIKEDDWDDIITINLKAPFMITRAVSKIMKRNHYGRIINIASVFGVTSREKRSVYSASKFGLRGLTVAGSNELAKFNVLVNTVSPGFVLTDLTKSTLSEKEVNELIKRIPVGRFAAPEEISRTVLFLASELNTYITGQNIIVDGGYLNA